MCGIVGAVSRGSAGDFSRAIEAMFHRGPDAGGQSRHEIAGREIQLGHRRLSIIDLSDAANQPFRSGSGDYEIVYNGEIYNHEELRSSLKARGYVFRTRSDTEVLLAGIELDDISFLRRVNGMFAFAVLDKRAARLILGRDPFGIKPLYVRSDIDGSLAFASEIGALKLALGKPIEIDPEAISEFLLNGFLYEPSSGFLGVEKIAPGCAVEIDLATLRMARHRYHDPLAGISRGDQLDALLADQIGLELQADVPVGVFFSGGVDSSVLLAAAPRDVDAFFIDYGDEQTGDSRYADAVAKALKTPLRRVAHRAEDLSAEAIIEEFRDVARGTEEPVSDYTFAATRVISRYAREAGYKVMLSGMGGDELFAGYPRHSAAAHWSVVRKMRKPLALGAGALRHLPRWGKKADRLAAFLRAADFAEAYTALVGYNSVKDVAAMTGSRRGSDAALERLRAILQPVSGRSWLRQAMHADRYGFLAHNLTVTDRASMAESIEVRVPLLNTRLESYAWSLDDSDLLRRGNGKLPLKRFLQKHLTTEQIHRPKVGFNPPLDRRIERLGKGLCEELVATGSIGRYLDPLFTKALVAEHFARRRNHTYRLWQLIYFRLWLDEASQRNGISL